MPAPFLLPTAEDEKRASRKFRLPAAFKRPGSRGGGGDADLASPSSTASGGAGGAFDPAAALSEFYGAGGASAPPSPDLASVPGSGAASPDSSRAGPAAAPGGSAPGAGRSGSAAAAPALLSDGDLVDYPYLVDGDPTPAAYLLLVCADYLRLYPAGGWVGG